MKHTSVLMHSVAALLQMWFTAERDYKGFSSPRIQLNSDTLKLHKSMQSKLGVEGGGTSAVAGSVSAADAAAAASENVAGTASGSITPWGSGILADADVGGVDMQGNGDGEAAGIKTQRSGSLCWGAGEAKHRLQYYSQSVSLWS